MWQGRKKERSEQVATLIGKETRVNGGLLFRGGLHVDGLVKGDIAAVDDQPAVLTVGESGVIEGDVRVPRVVLDGTVKGDVYASDLVELAGHGRVTGNIYYNRIEMAMGAEVNGQLIHRGPGQDQAK